jgi:ornithine carbamoyltransferase
MPYQLNRELLKGLDVRILHCLPAHHGYEIAADLLDDPRSLIFLQAENRLHSQKALILKLGGKL